MSKIRIILLCKTAHQQNLQLTENKFDIFIVQSEEVDMPVCSVSNVFFSSFLALFHCHNFTTK